MDHEKVQPSLVDIWVAKPVLAGLNPWLAHLDPVERARAAALPGPQAGRFVQARALLRAVLGTRLGCSASAVALQATCPVCGGPHGPVALAGLTRPFLSVTRSGPLIAVAVSDAGPVGVDIESHAAVAAAPFADVALSARDLAAHHRRRGDARTRALARSWVSTEATLKATGAGLRADPAGVDIRSVGGRRVVTAPDGTRAILADLDLGPGVAGAVALVQTGAGRRIVVRVHDGDAVLQGDRSR